MNLSKILASLFMGSIMFGLTPAYQCFAQNDFARGMVVYGSTLIEGPEFHKLALYSGYRVVAAWLDFDVGQKQPLRAESGLTEEVLTETIVTNASGVINQVPVVASWMNVDQTTYFLAIGKRLK